MKPDSCPPNPKAIRLKGRIHGANDGPRFDVLSIASYWCGVGRDDDQFAVKDVVCLLDLPPKGKLSFSARSGCLEIDFKKSPESLPIMVAKGVMATVETLNRILNAKDLVTAQVDTLTDLHSILKGH